MPFLLALALGVPTWSVPADAEETTVESLKDLQQLRQEVERRRQEMRRELRLLSQVLGKDAEAERLQTYEQSLHEMTAEELVAEMRILREEIEQLKETVSNSASAAGVRRYGVTGQVRHRFAWIDNDFSSGEGDLVSRLRSRVRISGAPHEKTRMAMEIQDSRLFGEAAGTLDGSGESIDFHQAYIELDDLFSQPISLKLGRQELSYGGERLVGAVNWHNVGRSFDAVKVHYGEVSTVDLFNAKLDETGVSDRNLFGIYGHVVHNKEHAVEPYLLYEHDKNSGAANRKRATVGLRADGEHTSATGHGVGYELEGALQAGELGGSDVFAWMASGSATYTGPSWTRPWLQVGADLLSGDSAPGVGDVKAFDTLFATNHQFYGLMDLFVDIPADTSQAGLIDFRLKGEMSASEKTRVALHLHHFALAEGAVKNLGQEADVVLTYAYNDFCTIQWAGLIFVPGDAMKATRGGEDPGFKTYLQTVASF
jgi:hypothetical protein